VQSVLNESLRQQTSEIGRRNPKQLFTPAMLRTSLPYLSKKTGLTVQDVVACGPVKHVPLAFKGHKVAPTSQTPRSLAEQPTPLNRRGFVCVTLRDESGNNTF